MLNTLLFVVVSVSLPFVNNFQGFLIGPGQWLVLNINTCDRPDQYEVKIVITRKKINRTHDCFELSLGLTEDIDLTYGIDIEVYQEVDGGFKYHQTIREDCVCTYFKKNAKKNMERAFTLAHIVPPDCPVPRGEHRCSNFVMDYTELPKLGLYGTFKAIVFIVRNKKRIACVQMVLNFEIRNEDDDDDNEKDVSTLSPAKGFLSITNIR